ncbi:MAG TPA: hypothetical protein VE195_01935 [Acidobacteriaceae bacterium]|nr:hypothetical protein [Acidobacteriaceae bacterium]
MNLSKISAVAAKVACAVFCADFVTMLLMNTLRLYTHWLPVIYFLALAAGVIWIFQSDLIPMGRPDYLSTREQRFLLFGMFVLFMVFAGLRLPYMLEGALHHLVGPVVYDDTWHFPEINSLVNSVRYPAQYSLMPSQYFSLYYAPWMLIAAIYLAIPLHGVTIKLAFAIGCAIYQVLVGLTLLHVGLNRAKSRRHFYWALYLVGCWAGVASLFALIVPFQHNSFWMACFGMRIELFNYFVLSTWAVHHLSAVGAGILSWHIWDRAEKKGWQVVLVCSLLASYVFYSSIFVFISALPMGILVLGHSLQRSRKAVVALACLSGALIWSIAWIYLGKPRRIGFHIPFIASIQFTSRRFPFVSAISGGVWFGFALFLLLLCFNFFPHLLALILRGKELDWKNRILVAMAIGFVFSTYFVGFPEGNSYASRGSVIPLIVLGWICADLLPAVRLRPWLAAVLVLGALGSVQEIAWAYSQTVHSARTVWGGKYSEAMLTINQSRGVRTASGPDVYAAISSNRDMIYYVEKFVPGGKHVLFTPDYELATSGPHGPWRWQKIAETSQK